MGALRTGILLILAGLALGAAVADWVDDPSATAAFLDEGWVRSVVDGWGWLFMIAALFIYAGRWGLALKNGIRPASWRRAVAIELVTVAVLAGVTALVLSWVSVQFIPCVLESRC